MNCAFKLWMHGALFFAVLAEYGFGGIAVVGENVGLESPGSPVGVVAETNGNLLVYGDFRLVNGEARSCAARLQPNGALDAAWRPDPNSRLADLAVGPDGIYLAGHFSSVAGSPKCFLAKVDAATGALITEFNPDPSDAVFAVASAGSSVFVGGSFTNIGGCARNAVAKLDAATGAAVPAFTNGPTSGIGVIYSLALDETGLYPAGLLFEIGGEARFGLAKVSPVSGNVLPGVFTDGVDVFGQVFKLRQFGDYVYAAGYFEQMGGLERYTFARLDRLTGEADAGFICGITNVEGGVVSDCLQAGDAVFVVGDFTNYAGQPRQAIVKVDLAGGNPVAAFTGTLNTAASGLAALPDGRIAVAGDFTVANGQAAGGLALLDPATGALDPSFSARVNLNGTVRAAVRVPDGGWILGGDFTTIRGVPIKYLARFDPAGRVDAAWKPNPSGIIKALALNGTNLYVGGQFQNISGQSISNLARLNLATGEADPTFNAHPNNEVTELALSGNVLYAGGSFANIGGGARTYLAKLDAVTGLIDPAFTAAPDAYVTALALDGARLYVSGAFTQINASACGRVARLDAASGAPDAAWCANASANNRISALKIAGDAVFVAGDFNLIGGRAITNLAKLSKDTGAPDEGWTPSVANYIFALGTDEEYLYVGGNFNAAGGYPITNAARFSIATGLVDTNWNPCADGTVYGFICHDPYVSLFGMFLKIGNCLRQGFATLTHAFPQVAFVTPEPGMDHWRQSVAEISLTAQAQADSGLAVTQVAYYANGELIGAASTAPYLFVWSPVYEGEYALTAVAFDQDGFTGTTTSINLSVTPLAVAADFDGDAKADPALNVVPAGASVGAWHLWLSGAGYTPVTPALSGVPLTTPLAGDVDGDAKADPTLWLEEFTSGMWQNAWYFWLSTWDYSEIGPVRLGQAGIAPVLADFDGDALADPAMCYDDGINNVWRVWCSSAGYSDTGYVRLGAYCAGTPLAADFDGDKIADPAKADSENNWRVWMSSAGYRQVGPRAFSAPAAGLPLAADFDGDAKADPALYVPQASGYESGWYVWLSSGDYRRLGPYAFFAP